jgi:MOSC domain-containing protein YiiM
MGVLSEELVARCPVCDFDATEWNEQDSARTLAHTDDLIAGWSGGEIDDRARGVVAAMEATDQVPERVHALWHGLVSIARQRRADGDVPTAQTGSVAQINRSGGGVPKVAVPSATVGRRGLEGDVQATRFHHGRPWQALCLWSADVIDALIAEGHPIGPGAAGENVTIAGLDWSQLRAGTVIDIGSVRCQLSAPAAPCSKNRKWFIGGEISRMDHDLHPGWSRWYASVLRTGTIATGDPVVVEPARSSR